MIAGQELFLLVKREAEMVRDVARRMEGLDGPSGSRHDIAMAQAVVGLEVDVHALRRIVARRFALARRAGRMGPEGEHRRATEGGQPAGTGGVVGMGVGDEYVAHRLVRQGAGERVDMGVVGRPRVDDRDHVTADHVGAAAVEGVLGRVVCDHPPE